MRDDRCAERHERCTPMVRVEMVSGGNLDQLVATGKLLRQCMEQIKSADYKSAEQGQDRCAEKEEQKPKQISRLVGLREKIIAQPDGRGGDGNQRNQGYKSVEHCREQCAGFLIRRFLDQVIAFDDVAAGTSGEKLVVKHPN